MKASIIIPVCNDAHHVRRTLAAIADQRAAGQELETIVIDNGSNDETIDIVRQFPRVTLLLEHRFLRSPYSCRNRGIEAATGEIIVLLDATCTPEPGWLLAGLRCLEATGADIVGGNVLFDFEGRMTAGKVFDSLTNIRMRESIQKRAVAKTANLFIRRSVFDKIGLFPEGIRSGADVRWTGRATREGCKLVFCDSAVVLKPARGFKELIRKQWRVGLHQPLIWREADQKCSTLGILRGMLTPMSARSIRRLLAEDGDPEKARYFWRLLAVGQCVKLVMAWANLVGLRKLKNR